MATEFTFSQESDILQITLNDHAGGVKSVAYSPDGKILASGSEDQTFNLYSTAEYELVASSEERYRPVYALAFTPDQKKLLIGAGKFLESFTPSGEYIDREFSRNTDIMSIGISPGSNMVLTGTYNKTFQVNILYPDHQQIDYPGHQKSALAVAFNADATLIASGSLDESIKLWETQPAKNIYTLQGHGGNIMAVTFSRDGEHLASASLDKSARLWRIGDEKSIQTFTGHQKGLTDIVFTPNGHFILTASFDQTIRLWEVNSGKMLYTFTGHEGTVNALAIAPDGKSFASASDDQTVKIWKLIPRVFVENIYFDQIENEIAESPLFLPKQKDESRADFKEREIKAEKYRQELYEKYYNLYMNTLSHR